MKKSSFRQGSNLRPPVGETTVNPGVLLDRSDIEELHIRAMFN